MSDLTVPSPRRVSMDSAYKADVSSQSIPQVREIMRLSREIHSAPDLPTPIMKHHDHRREIISGTIVNTSGSPIAIDIEVEEKKSDDRHTPPIEDTGYTKRFLIVTNAATALLTSIIAATVAFVVNNEKC